MIAIALFFKAVVPAGYMVSPTSKSFTVAICADGVGAAKNMTISIPAQQDGSDHDAADEGLCAFSGLSFAMTAGADAPLLAIALAFIVALGFGQRAAQPRLFKLRILPPAIGPPARG